MKEQQIYLKIKRVRIKIDDKRKIKQKKKERKVGEEIGQRCRKKENSIEGNSGRGSKMVKEIKIGKINREMERKRKKIEKNITQT